MLLKKANNFICKSLLFGKLSLDGRNNLGKITVRHRGGGVSRSYRFVDFYRYIWNVKSILLTFEYDSNRTSIVSLISFTNSVFSFILPTQGSYISSVIINSNSYLHYEFRNNYCANLNFIKPGLYINNLEFKPLTGLKYIRAGSSYGKLVSSSNDYSIIKLRSKVLLKVSNMCLAVVGVLLDKKKFLIKFIRNAGSKRNLGWRPSVRGVAMNPVDHPHGGGQGKTSGGKVSVTPWGKITKGRRTRRKNSYGTFVLKR